MPRSPCLVRYPVDATDAASRGTSRKTLFDEAPSGRTRVLAHVRRVFLKSTPYRGVQIGPHENGTSLRLGIPSPPSPAQRTCDFPTAGGPGNTEGFHSTYQTQAVASRRNGTVLSPSQIECWSGIYKGSEKLEAGERGTGRLRDASGSLQWFRARNRRRTRGPRGESLEAEARERVGIYPRNSER